MTTVNLKDVTSQLKGANVVHVTYRTPVKLTGGKKNPQLNRVEKVTITPAMIFNEENVSAYQNMVRRRQAQEGKEVNFTAGAPVWGWVEVAPGVVEYTDKTGKVTKYMKLIKVGKARTYYLLDGVEIKKSDIIGMPEYKKPEQGGIEHTVDIRTVKLDNVVRLSIKGNKLEGQFVYE
jgi:hypothetical protein